jgi:hypothetical protein
MNRAAGDRAGRRQPAPSRNRAGVQRRRRWSADSPTSPSATNCSTSGAGQRLRRAARQAVGDAGNQRLQLRHRRRSRRSRPVPRRNQRTQARQPARQAGCRTDDRRQFSTWGGLLAEKHRLPLPRADRGKVRMTTSPLPHEGLGVAAVRVVVSPLRRYVDLVNQWQLIACLKGETPPFKPRDRPNCSPRCAISRLTYAAYAEFQRHGALLVPALAAAERYPRDRRDRAPRAAGQARRSAAAVARAVAAGRSRTWQPGPARGRYHRPAGSRGQLAVMLPSWTKSLARRSRRRKRSERAKLSWQPYGAIGYRTICTYRSWHRGFCWRCTHC